MVAVARVPDLGDVVVGLGNAAENGRIFFPETPLRPESDLHRLDGLEGVERRLRCRREIVRDVLQHRGGNRADGMSCPGSPLNAVRSTIHDPDPVALAMALLNDAPV